MTTYNAGWKSPSNIALVKYWGKKKGQIPANPSISFTLDNALTTTAVSAISGKQTEGITLDFLFENQPNEAFAIKVRTYLESICHELPWLKTHHITIHSTNSFPHSSGIASSASASSALALCLLSIDEKINGKNRVDFFQKASELARLGSGSACRSVYGGYNLWGQTPAVRGSSDEYAVNIDPMVHPDLLQLKDTILIVEKGSKQVSSTKGHALLNAHPFAETRYKVAADNTVVLLDILKEGDFEALSRMAESEAMMLHAMMMTSPTPYILMKPNTVAIIEKILDFRNQTGFHLFYTLDAGANVHLISSDKHNEQVQQFVKNELVGYCQNGLYFCNAIGKGPLKTENA